MGGRSGKSESDNGETGGQNQKHSPGEKFFYFLLLIRKYFFKILNSFVRRMKIYFFNSLHLFRRRTTLT